MATYPTDKSSLIAGLRDPHGDAEQVPLEIDEVGPWLVVIDGPHHEIHEGETFYYHDVIQLGSAGTQTYLLTVPAGVYPHWGYAVDGLYGITVEVFEGTGLTQSAAAAATFNRNRASSKTAGMTVKKGTNGGSGDGTKIVWRRAGSGTSNGRLAGSSKDATERILNDETVYLFRVTSAAANNEIGVEFDWYEEGAD